MKQKLETALQQAVTSLLKEHGVEVDIKVALSRPRQKAHGDYACNVAMSLAGRIRQRPHDVAGMLLERVEWPAGVEGTEIAGPGFINIQLHHASEMDVLKRIIDEAGEYGRAEAIKDASVNIEFVSANPTGPMHVGHGRGAVVGDALAHVLAARGFDVFREYYINDAGAQIGVLAESVWLRLREINGETITLPEGFYPGEYVIDVARQIMTHHDFESLSKMDETERSSLLGALAIDAMMDVIRDDLASLGISFDLFYSERQLHESGRVQELIEHLKGKGLVYEGVLPPPKGKEVTDYQPVEQLLFRTTDFGDDVDRPLAKQDGSPTYFAADIAYHEDKHKRGWRLIDVWGADHGGYVTRVQAAMQALTGWANSPEVVLVQMVNLTREGKPVRMSKRAGTFVTLREVVDEVGRDAVRFNFLTRRVESQLDFDLEVAKQKNDENPVYYVQYAHARVCSIMRKLREVGIEVADPDEVDVSLLSNDEEKVLVAKLLAYPEVLDKAATRLEPYRVAVYLMELAAGLHTYYHKHRVMVEDAALVQARLLLMRAVRQVIDNGLGLLGVGAPEEM